MAQDRAKRKNGTGTLLLALLSGAALTAPGLAQDDRGGVTSVLTLSERLELGRNQTFVPGGSDLGLQSVTGLSFGYLSETRTETFSFDAGVDLIGTFASGTDAEFGLGPRTLGVGYERAGARSSFGISAGATQSDVSFFRPLTDFIEGDTVVFPEDFDDLTGTGTRTDLDLSADLSIRDDAPFGLSFSAGASDTSYRDTTDPDLVSSTRLSFGATARLDISSTIAATAGLRWSGFEDDAGTSSDSLTLTGGASFTGPRGTFGLSLSATPTDDGTQWGTSLSRSFELPDASLSTRLGLSLSAAGDPALTGGIDYSLERPWGSLAASLDQSVATDAGSVGDTTTSLSLSGNTALTPDLSASLRAGYARYDDSAEDTVTSIADLGATLSYALSPDWSLTAGATYILRDPSDAEAAAAQSVSLGLSRSFDMRN